MGQTPRRAMRDRLPPRTSCATGRRGSTRGRRRRRTARRRSTNSRRTERHRRRVRGYASGADARGRFPQFHRSAPMNITRRDSKDSRHLPAPSTTHSSGASTRCTGSCGLLGDALVEPAQHAAAADEVDALEDEVLGQLGRRLRRGTATTESMMARTCSSIASRTSSGERMTVLGRPASGRGPAPRPCTSSVDRGRPSRSRA